MTQIGTDCGRWRGSQKVHWLGISISSLSRSTRRDSNSFLSVDKFGLPLTSAPGLNPRRFPLSPCPMTMSDSFLAASRTDWLYGKEALLHSGGSWTSFAAGDICSAPKDPGKATAI